MRYKNKIKIFDIEELHRKIGAIVVSFDEGSQDLTCKQLWFFPEDSDVGYLIKEEFKPPTQKPVSDTV